MISFGEPVITGELAPIPLQPTPDLEPPAAATVEVYWGEAMVGAMARIDWFNAASGLKAHSTYTFVSCSGNTRLAARERDALIQLVVEKLTSV